MFLEPATNKRGITLVMGPRTVPSYAHQNDASVMPRSKHPDALVAPSTGERESERQGGERPLRLSKSGDPTDALIDASRASTPRPGIWRIPAM